MKVNLEITQLQESLIYTKAAFARVFGVQVKRVRRVMMFAIGFWVWVEGKRPRLYKKSIFQFHFVNFRKEAARKLTVSQTSSTEFWIKNEEKSVNYVGYKVNPVTGAPRYECGCEDFKTMRGAFKAPACKHVYSVLSLQGFESIKQSMAVHKTEFDARSALGI